MPVNCTLTVFKQMYILFNFAMWVLSSSSSSNIFLLDSFSVLIQLSWLNSVFFFSLCLNSMSSGVKCYLYVSGSSFREKRTASFWLKASLAKDLFHLVSTLLTMTTIIVIIIISNLRKFKEKIKLTNKFTENVSFL